MRDYTIIIGAKTVNESLNNHYKSHIQIQMRRLKTDAEKCSLLDEEMERLKTVIDKDPRDDLGVSLRPMLWDRHDFVRRLRSEISPIYTQDTFF